MERLHLSHFYVFKVLITMNLPNSLIDQFNFINPQLAIKMRNHN